MSDQQQIKLASKGINDGKESSEVRLVTRKQQVLLVGVILSVIVVSTIIFTLTFILLTFIYGKINYQPAPLLGNIINSLLGFIFCFIIFSIMGRYFGSKQQNQYAGMFTPIFDAMGKIAKGDFSVQIDGDYEGRDDRGGVMTALVKNVNSMAAELKQYEATRQEFISNVSHEIQSPLTSIRGFAQALQNDRLDIDERHHYLEIIETESTRLSRVTENLLKLATLESDQFKFEPKAYRLDKQLRSLILACEPQWASKQIEMDADLDALEICADEDLLSQVWINLLHNAIKFTPENGTSCVELHRHEDQLEVSVSDSGLGISEDDQARIFERFFKADKSRTRSDQGGSGLGLSIAHKIVEMHKGTIIVHSKLGSGTTFTVRLPANAA